jgi:hypothetical protein
MFKGTGSCDRCGVETINEEHAIEAILHRYKQHSSSISEKTYERLEAALTNELEGLSEPELVDGKFCSYCDYVMSKDD